MQRLSWLGRGKDLGAGANLIPNGEGFRCRCQVDAERGRIQAESNNLEAGPTPTPIILKILLCSIVEYLAEEKNRRVPRLAGGRNLEVGSTIRIIALSGWGPLV